MTHKSTQIPGYIRDQIFKKTTIEVNENCPNHLKEKFSYISGRLRDGVAAIYTRKSQRPMKNSFI